VIDRQLIPASSQPQGQVSLTMISLPGISVDGMGADLELAQRL
jgi:hypothetical protein